MNDEDGAARAAPFSFNGGEVSGERESKATLRVFVAWMGRKVSVGLMALSMIAVYAPVTFAQPTLAQAPRCDMNAARSLPSFDGLDDRPRLPDESTLRRSLARVDADSTPDGLWRRASIELDLAHYGDQAMRRAGIQHLAMIVQAQMGEGASGPDPGDVLYRLAHALQAVGQADRARQVFHRLIRGYPSHRAVAAAYVSFAEQYLREGDPEAADRFLERAESMARPGLLSIAIRYLRVWTGRNREALSAIRRDLVALRTERALEYAAHLDGSCRER